MARSLNLLPNSAIEFSSETYWDSFFTKKSDGFEWYGEPKDVLPLLRKCMSVKDKILVVGCGNSDLSHQLWLAGYENQLNIDISTVVIAQMKKQYPGLTFVQDDVTNLRGADGEYTCVLDKGTFDALSPPPSKEKSTALEEFEDHLNQLNKAMKMLEEVDRVLQPSGRFICISLLQPHLAEILVGYFSSMGWIVRITRCEAAERRHASGIVFPVYICVFNKVKQPLAQVFIEFVGSENGGKPVRLESTSELITTLQKEVVRKYYQQAIKTIGYASNPGIYHTLYDTDGSPKYVLHVVDDLTLVKNPVEKKFGVFIVPQGRESEYIFGTHEGRLQITKQAGVTRLVVVHLMRDRTYPSLDEVKHEIHPHLDVITPDEFIEAKCKISIMTSGPDLGKRDIVHKGKSEYSGEYSIEDVEINATSTVRRLIFINAPNVIQSEVGLKVTKSGRKARTAVTKTPLSRVLMCDHHGIMALCVPALKYFFQDQDDQAPEVLVVGLGGGLLVSFLHHYFPSLRLTAVELDVEVVHVARKYFGLPEESEDRLKIVVGDGMDFIHQNDKKYNVIMIDVDNKSVQDGLSCPPESFLTVESFVGIRKALKPDGILALNFVCRNPTIETTHLKSLCSHFPFIYQYKICGELNKVFLCFVRTPPGNTKHFSTSLGKSVRHLRDIQKIEEIDNTNTGSTNGVKSKKQVRKGQNRVGSSGAYSDASEDNIASLSDEALTYFCGKFKVLRSKD